MPTGSRSIRARSCWKTCSSPRWCSPSALACYARAFWRWPFGPAWWAFTFPLDALAYAATRYAQEHPSGPWKAVAGVTLLAAIVVVAMVLARTLLGARHLFSKRL